jgi:hypothetical protein
MFLSRFQAPAQEFLERLSASDSRISQAASHILGFEDRDH